MRTIFGICSCLIDGVLAGIRARRVWLGALTIALALGPQLGWGQTVYRDLHDFGGPIFDFEGTGSFDGIVPYSHITFDSAGNIYGTAQYGGSYHLGGAGMVWELTTAGVFTDLHDFGGQITNANGQLGPDGVFPEGGVAIDSSGNLYGTTFSGGPNNAFADGCGIVWEITSTGTYKDLHDFGGQVTNANGIGGLDGARPLMTVTIDSSNNIYGTTGEGGPNGGKGTGLGGIVWEITAAGTYKDLHDFGGMIMTAPNQMTQDGFFITGGVTCDGKGNLYGTANNGGAYKKYGMVWKIASTGSYTDLHDFGGTLSSASGENLRDGASPFAGASLDSAGNLYGTTMAGGSEGGTAGSGIVWEISNAGKYLVLHDFGGMVTNADGNLGADGSSPYGTVSIDASGNLYGTTNFGGPSPEGGHGMVWKLTNKLAYIDLYDFNGTIIDADGDISPDGISPAAGVTLDTAGNIYGTANEGGPYDVGNDYGGTLWVLTSSTLKGASISPASVTGGGSATCTVTLSGSAPVGGRVVQLASSSSSAVAPEFVVVPAGQTSATCQMTTRAVVKATSVTVTAVLDSVYKTATVNINPIAISSVSVTPATVSGGSSSKGIVTLTGPAPSGGVSVTLSSSSSSAEAPESVTVSAGSTSGTFVISTVAVPSNVNVTITATVSGVSKTATLTVEAPTLTSLTLSPTSVIGGTSCTGSVTLGSAAPKGGFVVTLTSSSKSATVPASVIVQAGSASATFTVKTSPLSASSTVTLSATNAKVVKTATLTINAPTLSSLSLNPTKVKGGTSSVGTVTLSGPAPAGGLKVTLSSSLASATVPGSVTVAAGSMSATFTVKTLVVKAQATATITTRLCSASKTATLTITP